MAAQRGRSGGNNCLRAVEWKGVPNLMKKTILREYARLIVRSGVNVQKGQDVLIYADLDQPEFVQMVVEEAYKAKARKVTVNWNYQPLQKLHVRYQSVKTLGTVEAWEEARLQHYVDILPCRIHLISEDPDGLKGVNLEKMAKGRQAVYQVVKPYADQRQNKEQWCIAAVPGAAWAKKVFPDLTRSQAMEKLWEAILATSRVNGDPAASRKKLAKRTIFFLTILPRGYIIVPEARCCPATPGHCQKSERRKTIMNIETLELIHKLLTEHKDNASRCSYDQRQMRKVFHRKR